MVERYCIIGAGACGLAVAKTFAERVHSLRLLRGAVRCRRHLESESPHVVYGSTFLNSSKKLSRYPISRFPRSGRII
jgi:cation diffusion facilitator CzcD-associated flavoprotein CzcO